MVAPTPKKPLFEGNYPSNSQPLFFEFALEPTPVSFEPQPTLSAPPPISSKSKKVLSIASRLVIGILITALIMGSGVLNNELVMGKYATQANLGWMPSWSEDAPVTSETTAVVAEVAESVETPSNPKPVFLGSEADIAFSTAVANVSNPEEASLTTTPDIAATPNPTAKAPSIVENAIETEETPKSIVKPIVKDPVSHPRVKLSKPVMNRKAVVGTNTSKITSEAFHAIKAASTVDGKKVFIKFGAKWCLPCRLMESNVFPDPEISQLLAKNYHTLTVDVDNIDGINLRQFYQVEALPSFIILDNQQNIVGKYEGAQRIEKLRSILGSMAP